MIIFFLVRHTLEKPLNENDWTDPNNGGIEGEPYVVSKLMAEKSAFDFVKSLPGNQHRENNIPHSIS